jgi:hypothetical protein
VGGGFIFLTVSVTFVRQDSTAFIRFGEWVSFQYKNLVDTIRH